MGEFVSKLFRSKKFQMFLVVLCIVLMPALGIIFVNIQNISSQLEDASARQLNSYKLADELRTYISEARDLLAKDMVERKSKDELDRCLAKAAELIDELD